MPISFEMWRSQDVAASPTDHPEIAITVRPARGKPMHMGAETHSSQQTNKLGIERDFARDDVVPSIGGGASSGRRVVIVIPGLGTGGTERVATFVSSVLANRGDSVTIVSCEDASSTPYYAQRPDVDIRYLGVPIGRAEKAGAIFDVLRRAKRLRSVLRSLSPDVVVSFLTRMNIVTVVASQGLGIPVIVSERNNPLLQNPGPIWRALRSLAYPRAAGLVTMTQGALNCFPSAIRQRGWVIPNFAVEEFPAATRSEPPFSLVAVGRLVDQKGFDLLLTAFAAISERHPDWVLRIWGEGPHAAWLRALSDRLGLGSQVEFAGVSREPGQWIMGADAFVLSSRYEGWGLVLGEAMAAGLPCISFDCDFGPAEMIDPDHDALLVPNGSVEQLASAMDRLMSDPGLRQQLGHAARLKMQKFAPAEIGKLWAAAIDEGIARRPSPISPKSSPQLAADL